MQVKRIHEYKRQLLNVLHVVHEYLVLVDDGRPAGVAARPRLRRQGGAGLPGGQADHPLINDVAAVVNRDPRAPRTGCKVVFVPDYRVSLAEIIIPAADLSEQISTAGTEASGTGNMKFAMNGALTIGTLDGANIEIREEVGAGQHLHLRPDRGRRCASIRRRRPTGRWRCTSISAVVRRMLDAFGQNRFCPREPGRHDWVASRLLAAGRAVLPPGGPGIVPGRRRRRRPASIGDRPAWAAKAILNVARMGKFSSDRTIRDYAREIWDIKPC